MPALKRLLTMSVAVGVGLTTGCFSARPSARDTFTALGARNLTQQPLRAADHNRFVRMTRERAEAAWREVVRETPDASYSRYYARGFVDGFMDYVEAGGTGEPPYLPPFCYRQAGHQDEAGPAAIQEWYCGFRHGAGIARTTGLREQYLIPLPGPLNAPTKASSAELSAIGTVVPQTAPVVHPPPLVPEVVPVPSVPAPVAPPAAK